MKFLSPLLTATALLAAGALSACGGDECGACAQAAADAHAEATYDSGANSFTLVCTQQGGMSTLEVDTSQCEASVGGLTIRVNDVISDSLESCGLSVPEDCS